MKTLDETERAYAAGIIDGEGSIMLIHQPPRGGVHKWEYWVLRISVANTDKKLIDWLVDKFGGGFTHSRSLNPRHRDVFQWRVDAGKARPVLFAVLPYLLLKREQADIAIQYLNTHRMVGCRGHSKEMIEQRRKWATQMKQLNSRGKEIPRWPALN